MIVTDKIAALMRQQIQQGVFKPGQKLPTRLELKERYSIARSSVDKVISILADEGLLISIKGSGTFVNQAEQLPKLSVDSFEKKTCLIMNTSSGCIESGFIERNWQKIISESLPDSKTSVITSESISEHIDPFLSQAGFRLIWSRPPFSALSYIDQLEQHRIPQVLVNRIFPDYSYFANDTKKGLKTSMGLIQKKDPNLKLAMLSAPMDPGLPFLAEREVAYHEACHELKATSLGTFRMTSYSHQHMHEACKQLLDQKPNAIFVNDHDCASPLISQLYQSGLTIGDDINIITMDWLDGKKAQKGIYCIRQNWSLMFEKALEWSKANKPPRIQELVEPELIYVNASME